MTLLTFENVSKFYGASPALQNVSLEIPAGKIVGLLGPNGSGKTTLIKLINGLLQPEQGRILINGMEPSPATKAIVSYLPDTTYLNEQMKVKEALTFFKTFYKDFNLERAQGLLRDLGIDENSRFKKLSKGNKEKVQLILVMAHGHDENPERLSPYRQPTPLQRRRAQALRPCHNTVIIYSTQPSSQTFQEAVKSTVSP